MGKAQKCQFFMWILDFLAFLRLVSEIPFMIKAFSAKSCRSCGFYIQSKTLSGNWGTYYFGDSWERCDSNYDIQFSCTNTTYKDADGNAEGDTVFVLTDCTTNERLQDGQDPRYQYYKTPELGVDTRYLGDLQSNPLDSIQTCSRGCYCGYNRNLTVDNRVKSTNENFLHSRSSRAPYGACERCPDQTCGCYSLLIGDYLNFINNGRTRFSSELNTSASIDSIPLTSTNITMLKHYQVITCNATVGEGAHGAFDMDKLISQGYHSPGYNIFWHWVADGDTTILQHGYECFGDFDSIGYIVNNYTLNYTLIYALNLLTIFPQLWVPGLELDELLTVEITDCGDTVVSRENP